MTSSQTDDLRSTYNRIAGDYSADHQHDTWDDDYVAKFSALLPATASMLDLGCGPGWELRRLQRTHLKQTGFDLSDELLDIARQNNPNATFVQGDMHTLPFRDHSFDGVFAKASLLHLDKDDVAKVIIEINRILKPGGVVHIALKKIRNSQPETEIKTDNDYGYVYQRYFSYWTMPELLELLKKHHFLVIETIETPSSSGRTTWLKILARRSIPVALDK